MRALRAGYLAAAWLLMLGVDKTFGASGNDLGLFSQLLSWGLSLPGAAVVALLSGQRFLMSTAGRLLALLLSWIGAELWLRRRPPGDMDLAPPVTRRALILTGVAGVCALQTANLEREWLEVTHHDYPVRDLPPELDGLTVALMSDWHCCHWNSQDYLRSVVRRCNALRPDLILLPGDFVSLSARNFPLAAELIADLRPRISGGVVSTLGNHDHRSGVEEALRILPSAGTHLLMNQSLHLNRRRELSPEGSRSGLWLVGLDDLWYGNPDLGKLLAPLPAHQPRLVLSHNPDLAEQQCGGRVDLMVSGHTHGGQIALPLVGSLVIPSAYGQKYARGLVQGPGYPVYVSRGVGVGGIPLRLGAPPELALFRLQVCNDKLQGGSQAYALGINDD
jgi:predicted MPP superfamily phosphohydrolase